MRPSVVGKCTSSICTAAILSSTALAVRPGASGFSRPQSDVQAIGEEGDEDMRLDPLFGLMIDRPQARSSFSFLNAASTSVS